MIAQKIEIWKDASIRVFGLTKAGAVQVVKLDRMQKHKSKDHAPARLLNAY